MNSKTIRNLTALLLAAVGSWSLATAEVPKTLFRRGHLDINWKLAGSQWSAEFFDDESFPSIRVPVDEGIMVATNGRYELGSPASEGARWSRPAGPSWGITGAAAGEDLWILPSFANGGNVLEPGFATYGVPFAEPDEVRIDVVGVNHIGEGDGQLTLLTTINLIHAASEDGLDAADAYLMGREDHRHFNWTFSAPGVYEIQLVASAPLSAGPDSPRVSSEPQTVMVAVGLEEASVWALARRVPAEQIGPNEAPAGDGVPNVIKYALGLDPLTPVRGGVGTVTTVEEGGEAFLALAVPRNPDATDVSVTIEASSDLVEWQTGPGHTVTMVDEAERLRVRDAVPRSAGVPRFLRLRVE